METDEVSNLDAESLVRMGCIETLNQGNIDETEKFYTDNATYYPSADDELSVEDLKNDALAFFEGFPDIEGQVDEAIVDGNQVTFRYTIRGTQTGQFKELPPTGESFETQGIGFARLEDGLIDEYSLVFDRLGMLDQLGVVG